MGETICVGPGDNDYGTKKPEPEPLTDAEIERERLHARTERDLRILATIDALRATIEEKEREIDKLNESMSVLVDIADGKAAAEIERLKAENAELRAKHTAHCANPTCEGPRS